MKIKSIKNLKYVTQEDICKVNYYKVTNDIEIDFVCIAEYEVYVQPEILAQCTDIEEVFYAIEGANSELLKEHVYDCPIAVNLEYMESRDILKCIKQL